MRNGIRRIILTLLAVTILLATAAPAALATAIGYVTDDDYTGIYLWEDSSLSMRLGDKLSVEAISDSSDDAVLVGMSGVKSSKTSVVSVTSGNFLKAKKAGTAKITISLADGGKHILTVTVLDPKNPKGIKFSKKKLTAYTGEIFDMPSFLAAKPEAEALDMSSITWKSNNKTVAKINSKGQMTAMKPGKATITAVTKNKKKATIQITVAKNKIDKINAKPKIGSIDGNDYEIYLKSLEITSPSTVVAEYYLVFTYPPKYKTTNFTVLEDEITAYDAYYEDYYTIVDGSVKNVKVSTKGQTVKVFKVTYKGSSVKHTDIVLKDSRGTITDKWYAYLNWKY